MKASGRQLLDSQPISISDTSVRALSSRTTTGSPWSVAPAYTRPGERLALQFVAPVRQVTTCPLVMSTIRTVADNVPLAEPERSRPLSLSFAVALWVSSPSSAMLEPAKRPRLLRDIRSFVVPSPKPDVADEAVSRAVNGNTAPSEHLAS